MNVEKDLSGILVASDSTKSFTINFAGEKWNFKVKQLPYIEISDIVSKCVTVEKTGTRIDKAEYLIKYLEKALIEAPWDLVKTRLIMKRIKSGFAVLLEEQIQNPYGDEVIEIKNESSQ